VWDTVELWNHEQAVAYRKKQEVPYDPSSSSDCIREATARLNRYGYCFITGVPVAPEPTEALLEQFGPIRNTHYGGFYDFTPDLAKADTAYTNIALPPHTDTTYFSEPAGLQSFHMLSHQGPQGATNDLGGSSILVDGFAAASKLYHEHGDAFECLSSVPIPWHASGNQGVTITPAMRAPVIEFMQSGYSENHLRIRWNNDDRGVVPIEEAEQWYAAARIWDSILKDKAMQYHFQLTPGTVLSEHSEIAMQLATLTFVVFDNWRVLHGRTAFEGIRRMSGAYSQCIHLAHFRTASS
jgi:trimethyllysine dioxygenase